MSLEPDWHCGWEAGPPPLLTVASPRRFCHAGQDLWQIAFSVSVADCIQDMTGGGDGTVVHSGRFAYGIHPLGLGDAISFTGARNSPLSTKDISIWYGWANMTGWLGTKGDTLEDQVYSLAHCGIQAIAGSAKHLGVGYIIDAAGGDGHFCIVKFDAGGAYNSYTAEVAYDYTNGDGWVLWILVYVDGDVNTATLYIRHAAGEDANSDNALDGYATASYSLPMDALVTAEKGEDEGPEWVYDDWSGGKCDANSDRPGWNLESQWYHPDGDLDKLWTPTPATALHHRNWDDQNQDVGCPTCTRHKPTGIGDDESVTLKNDPGSPTSILDVRILYDRCDESASAEVGHDIIVRQSGGAWAVKTPGYGMGSGGLAEVYCHGSLAGIPSYWHGWGSRVPFDGAGAWMDAGHLDAAEAGLRSVRANDRVASLGMSVMGEGLTRPTANVCPAAGYAHSQAVII